MQDNKNVLEETKVTFVVVEEELEIGQLQSDQ